jgi:CRP/FNR family transcriptional regulator
MSLACEVCPVRDSAACASLSQTERNELARSGRRRKLAAGDTLFAAGEDAVSCATLVSGALKVVSSDAEGNETILALVHPAGFIGELFAPFAEHDVVALTQSEVCLFSRSDLESAVEQHPA